jgi:hypothetical protein
VPQSSDQLSAPPRNRGRGPAFDGPARARRSLRVKFPAIRGNLTRDQGPAPQARRGLRTGVNGGPAVACAAAGPVAPGSAPGRCARDSDRTSTTPHSYLLTRVRAAERDDGAGVTNRWRLPETALCRDTPHPPRPPHHPRSGLNERGVLPNRCGRTPQPLNLYTPRVRWRWERGGRSGGSAGSASRGPAPGHLGVETRAGRSDAELGGRPR